MQNVCIVDTGISNTRSLVNALNFLNIKVTVIETSSQIKSANCLIIPGVGSFDKMMTFLENKNMTTAIISAVNNSTPILGICSGMQVLFTSSEEGEKEGLNILKGHLKKLTFESKKFNKVPNTGFRKVNFGNLNFELFKKEFGFFYFNHSYVLMSEEFSGDFDSCMHNKEFVASFRKNNIFGMQFHPEKSHEDGLMLLKNFIKYSLSN